MLSLVKRDPLHRVDLSDGRRRGRFYLACGDQAAAARLWTAHRLYHRPGFLQPDGLSTRIPGTVVIANRGTLEKQDLGPIKVRVMKSRVADFTEAGIPALEVLNNLTDVDQIPGTLRRSITFLPPDHLCLGKQHP